MAKKSNNSLIARYDASYYDKVYSDFDNDEYARCWAIGSLATMGLENKKYSAVLEFGAGLGQNLSQIQAEEKWAVDINPQSKLVCEAKGFKWTDSLESVPNGMADIVIARHSLEHVSSPYETLLALRQKLKPEGKMFLVVPVETGGIPKSLTDYDEHCHLFSWTPMTMKNLLIVTGWQIETMTLHNGLLFIRSLFLLKISTAIFLDFRNLITHFGPLKSAEIIAVCVPGDSDK
ncbi:class I SAM-dependent methyltransferase [Methylomonas methanica]|uniref:Methyltransferase type 11 n=1 Tax=Methylomonas methanica (strain DSM 25384 / MC09) TaxID=857087 RepID=F9ZW40_METMM|nr:class I SAM-dependent methyltransferase [Methylomonas methanica]AEG02011.1 Methyltransferase type 11 [Methylomonas methanica MC09]